MKVIYISSTYTLGDVKENVMRQIDAAHKIMDMGHAPIAPLLSHFLHLRRERPYDDWMVIDLAIVPKCDILLRLDGESAGAEKEVKIANECNIPIVYSFDELIEFLNK